MRKIVNKKLKGKEYFGHPAGLYVLFFTEMWERFSFYGMRALLVLYMTDYLLNDPEKAKTVLGYSGLESVLTSVFGPMNVQAMSSQLYGLYTGLVYFTPIFGGMLADKYLGQYRTVYLGGILMAIGQFLMASESLFLVALTFIILGNGCFKPNVSTQVGNLYTDDDVRRDGAYSIYYMGINLGAFFAPLVCGTLGQKVGWHWGFASAGVGMVIGLIVYWMGTGLLENKSQKVLKAETQQKAPMSKEDWSVVIALCSVCVLTIMFWGIYEQQGNTLQIWADKKTAWPHFPSINIPFTDFNLIPEFEIPSTWFQSFNAFFIVALVPLMNIFWLWQEKRGWGISSITKMSLGTIICGLAYLIMILAAKYNPGEERSSLLWLLSTSFVLTLGEIYLSPIGLSLINKVAPVSVLSTMMGVWFLSSFFGNYSTGLLGMFYGRISNDQFFVLLAAIGIITGGLFYLMKKPLQKHIKH